MYAFKMKLLRSLEATREKVNPRILVFYRSEVR